MRKLTKTTVQVAAVVALTAGLVAMATPSNNSKIKYDSQQSASEAAGSSKAHKMDKISSERERLVKEAKRKADDKKKVVKKTENTSNVSSAKGMSKAKAVNNSAAETSGEAQDRPSQPKEETTDDSDGS